MLQEGRGPLWRELEEALGRSQPTSWRHGWQLAAEVGAPLAPALWRRHSGERNRRERLVWLAAWAAAAGAGAHAKLLDARWLRLASEEERLLGLLHLALGPYLEGDPEPLREVLRAERRASLRIAIALALARFRAEVAVPAAWFEGADPDPGLVAAALLGGGMPPAEAVARWLRADPGDPAVGLVWRAALLAPAWGGERVELAERALGAGGRSAAPVRRAAALALARAAQEPAWEGAPPDPDVLVLLAGAPVLRAEALGRGWLQPAPSKRILAPERGRLVVWYVLAASPAELAEAVPLWNREGLAATAALAIALRTAAGTLPAEGWTDALAAPAQRAWIDVARGRAAEGGAGPPGEAGAPSEQVRALAAAGRLPASVVARLLEEELWRRGEHPGLAAQQVRAGLVRDLLLAGSDYARSRRAGEAFPYLPEDLPRDDPYFEVAYELYDWHVTGDGGVPDPLRLVE